MKYIVISFAALLAAVSCSIKENREHCPCLLTVDMSESLSSDNVQLSVRAGDWSVSENLNPSDGQTIYEYEIPKGICRLYAVEGAVTDEENKVTVPSGKQFGAVFAYSSQFLASGDRSINKVQLHKEYALITLDLNEAKWQDEKYKFVIWGGVCGINLEEIAPCEGKFCYELPYEGSAYRTVRVPRQKDDSLLLILTDGSRTISEIKIGELIEDYGFDWTKEDLGDIMIKVPDLLLDIFVSVSEWNGSDVGEVKI